MSAVLVLSCGLKVEVKGTPEEVVKKIASGPKPDTNFVYNSNDGTVAYSWVELQWAVFEAADNRRMIHVRPDRIDAIEDGLA